MKAMENERVEKPLWDPYLAGFVLGLVLLATYLVFGRGLVLRGRHTLLRLDGPRSLAQLGRGQ